VKVIRRPQGEIPKVALTILLMEAATTLAASMKPSIERAGVFLGVGRRSF
jgi:hypothetical protein